MRHSSYHNIRNSERQRALGWEEENERERERAELTYLYHFSALLSVRLGRPQQKNVSISVKVFPG